MGKGWSLSKNLTHPKITYIQWINFPFADCCTNKQLGTVILSRREDDFNEITMISRCITSVSHFPCAPISSTDTHSWQELHRENPNSRLKGKANRNDLLLLSVRVTQSLGLIRIPISLLQESFFPLVGGEEVLDLTTAAFSCSVAGWSGQSSSCCLMVRWI